MSKGFVAPHLSTGNYRFLNLKITELTCIGLFLVLLVENPLESIFTGLSYLDEALFAFAVIMALATNKITETQVSKEETKVVFISLGIVVVGVVGNICSGYQTSCEAIAKDIVAFLKFPLTLVAILSLTKNVDTAEVIHSCSRISSIFIVVSFLFGILNILSPIEYMTEDFRNGIWSYKFIYSHPTFLVFALVVCFVMISAVDKRLDVFKVLCLITMALTMRDKALGFIGFVVVVYILNISNRRRVLPTLLIAISAVLLVAWPKIATYMAFSNSPREAMYLASASIALEYFPFGSGFASIACSLSGEYYSKAYLIYGMSTMEGLTPFNHMDVGDAGGAYYLGQFGILGTFLTILLAVYIYRLLINRLPSGSPRRFAVFSLLGYLGVALTVETVFTNATGAMAAILLALFAVPTNIETKSDACA